MEITVLCFGHYSEAYPEPIPLEVEEEALAETALSILGAQDARFAGAASYCRFAVNEAYCSLDTRLHPGDRLAILPPMSGG